MDANDDNKRKGQDLFQNDNKRLRLDEDITDNNSDDNMEDDEHSMNTNSDDIEIPVVRNYGIEVSIPTSRLSDYMVLIGTPLYSDDDEFYKQMTEIIMSSDVVSSMPICGHKQLASRKFPRCSCGNEIRGNTISNSNNRLNKPHVTYNIPPIAVVSAYDLSPYIQIVYPNGVTAHPNGPIYVDSNGIIKFVI